MTGEAEQMVNTTKPAPATAPQTGQIWEEAGFLPPATYQKLVESLHCLNMGEEIPEKFCHAVCCTLRGGKKEFVITSPARLVSFAESCGISCKGKSVNSVAEDVFFRLVAEYFGYEQESGL